MARGLVDVDVDGHHELETFQRVVERASIRRRQHRIARTGEQGADLAVAGGGDFLGHAGHRQLAREFGQPAHAAAPAPLRAGIGARPGDRHRGIVRQRAADAVEVAAHQVDQLQQDLAQRAPGLHRHAHAAVGDGTRGGEELGGDLGDDVHRDAGLGFQRCGVDGVDRGQCGIQSRQASCIGLHARRTDPLHGLQQRQQEQGIATRTDREVLAGDGGGFRAARIDHDQLAARG